MISSLLDTDWYSFTMGSLVWKHFRNFQVRYAFKNRTLSVRLGDYVDVRQLRQIIDDVRALRFSAEEIEYIRSQDVFSEGYLEFLTDLRMCDVEIENNNGWLTVEYEADWPTAIFWECPLLKIIMALYMRRLTAEHGDKSFGDAHREGMKRAGAKIEIYHDHPSLPGFFEFGARRPFPGANDVSEYQERMLGRWLAELPDKVLGTSNPMLAKFYGIPVSGTQAHQLEMVIAANVLTLGNHVDPIGDAQKLTLNLWEAEFGNHPNLLCFLPDTFTTSFFMSRIECERIEKWGRWRQDSGDPFTQGDKIVNKIRECGIDPMTQLLVPSNALDINTMLSLHYHFDNRIPHVYGWGGNLMNDTGYDIPSMVIKPMSVNGVLTVKLSDDMSKATGTKDEINRYKELVKNSKIER